MFVIVRMRLKILIEGALSVALSIALSYIKLFSLPQGGSVSLSMLPLLVFALRRGGVLGMTAGATAGFMHIFLGGYIVHPLQALLDYPVASAALGLAGFFRNKKYLGITAGVIANMFSSVLSGVFFFSSYAPKGMNVWLYSVVYNGSAVIPEGVICGILLYLIWPRIKNLS